MVRSIAGVLVAVLSLSACSSAVERPASFDNMSADDVGCTVEYGDDALLVVGPLGPSDSEDVKPNDYTVIRLGRTASDLVVTTDFPDSGSSGGAALNTITPDGDIVARGPFRNGGEPGYIVTCWRGDG
ncbi:MAG: hypothetical protein GWP18_00795 [Proteobacteria bacterium]|nr:hypothetical protein [Pseudomonadota bacterium]